MKEKRKKEFATSRDGRCVHLAEPFTEDDQRSWMNYKDRRLEGIWASEESAGQARVQVGWMEAKTQGSPVLALFSCGKFPFLQGYCEAEQRSFDHRKGAESCWRSDRPGRERSHFSTVPTLGRSRGACCLLSQKHSGPSCRKVVWFWASQLYSFMNTLCDS